MDKISFELGKIYAVIEYRGYIQYDVVESVDSIIEDGKLNQEDFKRGMIKYLEDENLEFTLFQIKEIMETLFEKKEEIL